MFYNDIFNIIILLTFIMLAMNIQILQSMPAMTQYSKDGLYDRKQRFYYKEKIYANKRNTNNGPYFKVQPKHKRLLSQEELQQKEYEKNVNKIKSDLLAGEKLFDRDGQSFDKWWFQNDDNNEIFHSNIENNFSNNVNQSWFYQQKSKDAEEASINSYKNKYDDHQSRHSRYNYNDLNLFDEEYNDDLEILSYLTPRPPYELKTQIHRREAIPTNDEDKQFEKSSLYPSVLTKAVEISLNPSISPKSGGNLLENVAQKMNTSTLDLATKLAKSPQIVDSNGHLAEIVQGLMKNNAAANRNASLNKKTACALQNEPSNIEVRGNFGDEYLDASLKSSGLSSILERILNKLNTIHDANDKDDEEHPDGAPCDVIGTWSSSTLGLCFDIQSHEEKIRDISPAEINNKILLINCKECTPAKHHHQLFDLQWKFKGSALKQLGGPLYMYGQKRSENMAATFLGFCRTCGGIDTIFGSWNILSPSKDCTDISLAFEVRRDVLRRSLMEKKRKERIKNVLYQSRLG